MTPISEYYEDFLTIKMDYDKQEVKGTFTSYGYEISHSNFGTISLDYKISKDIEYKVTAARVHVPSEN